MTDKLEDHDDIIEVFVDYKKGLRTMKTATAEMVRLGVRGERSLCHAQEHEEA